MAESPKSLFDHRKIDVPCPQCRRKHPKTVGWLRTHDGLTCAGCGVMISLKHEQFRRDLAQIDKALADLRRSLANLGKVRKK